MSLFKCKMCGGSIDVDTGATVVECEYCGTVQTVPKALDENLQNLFNRANTLRMKSEFDKAERLYEKIIQVDSTQSEAYWGLILCKYGIEYVDDPATFKKIPTCHRTSYDSVIADDDYKAAIENADMSQRIVYEDQAKEIDRIQKDILSLAQKEETYDVFICYKETDADGHRTQDSVIANDIYYQLTQEGFKVFYAAITLEGKLGSSYEPIIFAALNSAKVMLAIGTKPEYFNAVWVKNEWSRFLKIIKKDRSKLLIPCYRDMDAYELPEEFAHLQAQDMSKIGFINDIVRGIKKVIPKDEPKQTTVIREKIVSNVNTNSNIAPLIKRIFMFLEDDNWAEANEYCEKVLDIDPECADAYLGKLLAELKVFNKTKLEFLSTPFDNRGSYKKIMRFGDEKLVNELAQYNNIIRERNEQEHRKAIYSTACELAKQQTPEKQMEAAKEFEKIPGYRDANVKAKECHNNAILWAYDLIVKKAEEAITSKDFKEASKMFLALSQDYLPAKEKAEECMEKSLELAEIERKEKIYFAALDAMNKYDIPSLETAIEKFQSIVAWKDSEDKIAKCKNEILQIKKQKAATERKIKRFGIFIVILFVCFIIWGIFLAVYENVIVPNTKYQNAISLMEKGEFEEAIIHFNLLEDFRDSANKIKECESAIPERDYNNAVSLMNQGNYEEAITCFRTVGYYKDSSIKIIECNKLLLEKKYNEALTLFESGNFTEAISKFESLNDFKDAKDMVKEARYQQALNLWTSNLFEQSNPIFESLGDYKSSKKLIHTHEYDSGKITTSPSCESEGTKLFQCVNCSHSYSESVAATGHKYDKGTIITASGCETKGTKKFKCENCDKSYTESVAATGHKYDNGVITIAPKCESLGAKTIKCKNCDKSYTESVSALGHDYGAASCVGGGKCSRCTSTTKPLGHTTTTKTCDRCNFNFTPKHVLYGDDLNNKVKGYLDCDLSRGRYSFTVIYEPVEKVLHFEPTFTLSAFLDGGYKSQIIFNEEKTVLSEGTYTFEIEFSTRIRSIRVDYYYFYKSRHQYDYPDYASTEDNVYFTLIIEPIND